MKHYVMKLSCTLLGLGMVFACWAENPCMPIAQVCMGMGYYKGGESSGKGLVKDCVMPVVMGSKTLPNTNFDSNTLQQCKTMLMEKMSQQPQ